MYDADMEIMHPNRGKMIQIAMELLPFCREDPVRALELGSGTGLFTEKFLRSFRHGTVVAVDGAASMIEIAKARLGKLSERTNFVVHDFHKITEAVKQVETTEFDVAFTSFALHHLDYKSKLSIVSDTVSLLRRKGWFLNADLIVSKHPEAERRIQELRIEGILKRAGSDDPRFSDFASTRVFLDALETEEGDQPISFPEDLSILRAAGLSNAEVYWLEHREAVLAGFKD
jgi:ubiquinone/menaquinone biosynthesis C-methylase UbiE